MKLLELLNRMLPDDLLGLADMLRVSAKSDQDELLAALSSCYTKEALQQRYESLTSAEQVSLEMIAAVIAEEQYTLSYQETARKLDTLLDLVGAGFQTLQELKSKGFVFIIAQGWSEAICLPEEVQSFVFEKALDRMHGDWLGSGPNHMDDPDVRSVENRGLAIYHDIITLIANFSRQVIEITQKGHVYRRAMKPMLQMLRTTEYRFPDTFGEAIPRNYYFLESFLKYSRIVSFDHHAVVNKTALQQLLSSSYTGWAERLYDFFLRRVFVSRYFPTAFLKHLFYRFDQDGWMDADSMFEWFDRLFSYWGIPFTRSHLDKICYDPFTLLGLIEWGESSDGRSCWRWTELGKDYLINAGSGGGAKIGDRFEQQLSTEIYVQPNLEIIVPERVLPSIRWSVESFAELVQADTVYVYKLSRERLLQALEAGWTVSKIIAFLHQFSKIPVADNVQPALEGWVGNYGKAALWDVMILQLEDPSLARTIKNDRSYAKWVVTAFSDQILVIRRKDEQHVRKWLEDLGVTMPLRVNAAYQMKAESDMARTELTRRDEEKKRTENAVLLHNLTSLTPLSDSYFNKADLCSQLSFDVN